MLVESLIAFRQRHDMTRHKRARPGEGIPEDVKAREGKALHGLWRQRKKRTQAEFAADHGFTQGYLPQFFGGHRPLTLDLARKFAVELSIDISDFSPRLAAEELKDLESGVWPFHAFSREDFASLTKDQRGAIERLVSDFLAANGAKSHPKVRKLL